MTRKDVTQDIDRPHYYSQFWIDVATGKRDVTAGRVAEAETDVEDIEDELDQDFEPAPPVAAKPPVKPKSASKAPEKKPEPARPTITSLADLANIDLLMKSSAEMEGGEVPDIESGAIGDLGPLGEEAKESPVTVPDIDYPEAEAEVSAFADEDEGLDEELDYDEEEEEDGWSGSRKPSKQQKQQQQRRRERRPNF